MLRTNRTDHKSATCNILNLLLKTTGITLLALLLSMALEAPFSSSASAIFSNPEKNDFTLTDVYAQIADGRPVRKMEDRIAIVDIGLGGREEIADALELLQLCGVKAVGVDVNFEEPHEDDSRLLGAIASLPDIVLPLGVEPTGDKFRITDKPFFLDMLDGPRYGVINLPGTTSKSSIREFAVDFPMEGGKEMPSFVSEVLRVADPQAWKKLKQRDNRYEISSYHSREFPIYTCENLADNAEKLADKIVLIGALGDAYDMHSTPINSYMPGLMIHAHALATALDGNWYATMPRWADYLTAFAICFLIVLAVVGIKNGVRGLLVRIIQIVMVYAAVRIGYTLFIDHNLICNFSNTLLMIAFGLFAVDIWNGMAALINMIRNKITKYRKRRLQDLTCENTF